MDQDLHRLMGSLLSGHEDAEDKESESSDKKPVAPLYTFGKPKQEVDERSLVADIKSTQQKPQTFPKKLTKSEELAERLE